MRAPLLECGSTVVSVGQTAQNPMIHGNNTQIHDLPAPMARSLELAAANRNATPPNPSVGCVITSADGAMLGHGFTQATGGPHAEIHALRDAQARGNAVVGATAYVTLEPCAHHGRTAPCCDALVAAGIGKVVAAIADPNPQVAGRGFARLQAAGVVVEVGPGAEAARELNLGFFSRMVRKTPWLRMKIAASLDGRTALNDGTSQWITSEPARADGHAWRARASAVLTGIGTVLEDDPQLDVQLVDCSRQPMLVIVDSALQTPLDARLWHSKRPVLIYGAVPDAPRQAALAERGATVVLLPGATVGGRSKVDLAAMLADLAVRDPVRRQGAENHPARRGPAAHPQRPRQLSNFLNRLWLHPPIAITRSKLQKWKTLKASSLSTCARCARTLQESARTCER